MADLTSKLADSIKKSMSGFGAGIKGSFMSANPAGFGLAMKGIQSVMNSQIAFQKKDFDQRQRDRQFAEENANEQKKVTNDMLGTLHSIDNTLKRMLQLSLAGVKKEEWSPKFNLKALLGGAGVATAGGKVADAMKDGKTAKTFVDTLSDIFKGIKESLLAAFRILAKFFSSLPGMLMEGIKNLIKFFKDLPGNLIEGFKNLVKFFKELPGNLVEGFRNLIKFFNELPGKMFSAFANFFPETAKAIAKFVEEFKKFFRIEELGLWFAEKLAKLKEFFKIEELGLWFADKFNKLKEFFKLDDLGLWFADKFNKLKEFFKLDDLGLWFADKFAKLKEFFKVEGLGLWFAEKMTALKNFFKIDEFALLLKGKIAELVLSFALTFGGLIDDFGKSIKESTLGKLVSSFFNIFDTLFTEIGKKLEPLKDFFSKTFGGIIDNIKNILGIGEEGAGIFAKLAEKFPMLAKTFGSIAKIIPFLDIIIFAVEGLFAAFNTEQIKKDLNVREVTVKDRIAAFTGGGIAAFTGGLVDLAFMISDWVFDTKLTQKSLKEGGEGTYQERVTTTMTNFVRETMAQFGDYWSAIKNVLSGNFDAAKKDMEHAALFDQAWNVRIMNFFGEIGVSIWNWLGELGTGIQNVFGSLTNWIGNKIKGSETIGVIYDSVSSAITTVQNFVGKLFYDMGNIIDGALFSARSKIAELADKFIPDFAKTESVKKFIADTKAAKEAPKAAYVPYVAQKYSQNYKQTQYVPKTFEKATWNTIANPAQDILDAEKTTKNEAYGELQRESRRGTPSNTVSASDVSGAPMSGSSSLGGYNTVDNSSDIPAIRNNNPGNLRYYADNSRTPGGVTYEAAPGPEGSFAVFPTKEAGLAAMRKQIVLDTQTRGMTLAQFITKYAPPGDKNDTEAYINNMARAIGISPGDRIPANKIEQLQAAMIVQEGGSKSSSYFGTPSTGTLQTKTQNSGGRSFGAPVSATSTSGYNALSNSSGSAFDSGFDTSIYEQRSNVNSPDAPPTGTENKPIYTVSTEENPVDQVKQEKVEASIIKAPELSQAQLDEMKRQQVYREKMDAENKKYRDERDNLEKQFRATLENNIRGQLTAAIPMGATGAAATTNAGGNIANKYLTGPMNDLATKLFGKETGKGVGTIFTQLAGSYGNQLISNVLAPALGMEGGQLNRAFNNFASGNKGAGWADLMYGMTGISTDLRTAFGYEEGINNFSKNLANITAQPFSPLFNMGNTSGVSPAEVSATNAGIITQNAATQNAQIMVAAGQAFGQSVVGAASDFGKSVANGGQGSMSSTGGGPLGMMFNALIGGGSATGGGTKVYGPPDADGNYSVYTEASPGSGGTGFLANLGNMLSGGRSRDFAGTGANFVANLGGSFIGNKLGINTNSFGGVLAQTGINATLKSLLTTGGPGVMATLAGLAPGALFGPGIVNLGSMIGGGFGNAMSAFGGGMATNGLSAGANAMNWLSNPTSMIGEGASSAATLAGQAGSLAGAAGAAYGGVMISRALSGGYKLDGGLATVNDIVTAVSSVFGPLGMVVSGVISATVNRLFGMKAPELRGLGIQGTVGASTEAGGKGTSLEGWKNMYSKGGAYRSDKNEGSTFAIDPAVADALMKDVDANLVNMKKATALLGLDAGSKKFEDYTQFIKLDFQNKSVEEQQKLLEETLKTFNNGMLESVFPVFASFKEAGEDSTTAMTRLANVTSTFDAGWKMLGYSSIFNPSTTGGGASSLYTDMLTYGVDATLGQALTDSYGGLNIDALRAAKMASDPAFADSYYNMKQVQTNVGATRYVSGGMYSSGYHVAADPEYKMVRDGINAIAAQNNDNLLAANFAQTVFKSFGGGDLEKGKSISGTASQSYFSKYYSAKEQRDIALKSAQEKIADIEKETGGTGLSGVDSTTKYQDKLDNYRKQVEAAKAAMIADPTNQTKVDTYTKLMSNADAYATSVQNIIGLSKAIANPQDAAQKNANLQASLEALASETKFLGINGTVSLADVAGSTFTGASSLGGYNVTQNVAAVTGVGVADGTGIPNNNNNNNNAVITPPGGGGGTLFAPTTYVDNTSSTNVNAASGNDNVRDTYSHPILGSTERSVSSTYNYNYLYR